MSYFYCFFVNFSKYYYTIHGNYSYQILVHCFTCTYIDIEITNSKKIQNQPRNTNNSATVFFNENVS